MVELLGKIDHPQVKKIISDPLTYRCQIIYTQIDRTAAGKPVFTHHPFQVDANLYFNPASMVKMPLAFLSMEKLNEMKIKGVDRNTIMAFDSSYERQVAMETDSTSENRKPSLAHFIRRAFLISENDPYNRMYQFVGQQRANRKLQEKGYASARITRQFMGYTEDQNRHTPSIRLMDNHENLIHQQPAAYNTDSFHFPAPILIGNAHINREEQLVQGPFDFTRHNNISLEDMQQMLQSVVFPKSLPASKRFNLKEDDRRFLLQYLSQYPSETDYPKYDDSIFYDSYVKFFFQDSTRRMPSQLRVFNKVGWAYGFLTDVSYVVDTLNNIDYMLAATVYVNSDGVVNDSKYDEETVGFPFLKAVGEAIYRYDLHRKRQNRPTIGLQGVLYDRRNPLDKRPEIKVADN